MSTRCRACDAELDAVGPLEEMCTTCLTISFHAAGELPWKGVDEEAKPIEFIPYDDEENYDE